MSLRGVELQIAIPKTFDAGKMVDQAQQQVLAQQTNANEALKREIERKNSSVNTSEETDEIHGGDDSSGEYSSDKKRKKKDKKECKKTQHPFKGNFVDFSG